MSAVPARGSLVAVGLVGLMAVASLLIGDGRGQPPAPVARRDARKAGPTRTYIGAETCAQCHAAGPGSGLPGLLGETPPPALVRLDEARIWDGQDAHRRAFDVLLGERGARIGKLMGIADVGRETSCLTCHSTGFLPADAPFRVDAERGRQQGVSCIACHGAYLEWVQGHGLTGTPSREWRSRSAESKQEDFGMTDLRDPATRSSRCYSCHIGNAREGKVVTHRMYAAGHPPLPGIEVATSSRAMPPHWWEPADVPLFQADRAIMARYGVDPSELRQTRLVIIGGVVALREAMELLAATIVLDAKPEATGWPDFASFDCNACHHDLQAPGYRGWRQLREAGRPGSGVPGRPQARPWPFALARLGLAQVEAHSDDRTLRAELEVRMASLHKAFNARPFGDAPAVAEAARTLAEWSERLRQSLEETRFEPAAAPRLLKALAHIPDDDLPEYDSARQIAWAFRMIHSEWKPRPANDGRIRSVLGRLDERLTLDRHPRRDAHGRLISAKPVEDQLAASLARAAAYDPFKFKEMLGELSALLPDESPAPVPR